MSSKYNTVRGVVRDSRQRNSVVIKNVTVLKVLLSKLISGSEMQSSHVLSNPAAQRLSGC